MQFTSNEGISEDAPILECESEIDHYQERIKGTEKASPQYTPYSIGNSSRVIFNTTDLKGA